MLTTPLGYGKVLLTEPKEELQVLGEIFLLLEFHMFQYDVLIKTARPDTRYFDPASSSSYSPAFYHRYYGLSVLVIEELLKNIYL